MLRRALMALALSPLPWSQRPSLPKPQETIR
jgi:hypothetical protein